MSHFYDDREFSYLDYWKNRNYEHQSEVLAIKKFLGTSIFEFAADIGGGFGRLTQLLAKHAKKTFLIEPSHKQRVLAKSYLKGLPGITIGAGTTDQTKLADQSMDLIMMIRVMHHLPDTGSTFVELDRIIRPGGLLILEFANSLNLKARIVSWLTGKAILPIPLDRRRQANVRRKSIPFVNHHPISVIKVLKNHGFEIMQILSVSNFRGMPIKPLGLEKMLQTVLGRLFFGPSIFILAKKTNL